MISIDLRIKSYKKLWIGKSNVLHFTFIYDTSPISLNSPLSTNYQLILCFFKRNATLFTWDFISKIT